MQEAIEQSLSVGKHKQTKSLKREVFLQEKVAELIFPAYVVYKPEKAMAPHSSTLAWKIPWAEEPGRLQSMGLQRHY